MSKRKNNRWLFATNTDNMMAIIAQGLITGRSGFQKYYEDILELLPDYIPLFNSKIPSEFLEKCVSETDGLTPCILEFSLKGIHGTVKTVDSNNQIIDIGLDKLDEVEVLFIPAPLPLTTILKIIFENFEDKKSFENDTTLYRNVALVDLKLHWSKTDQKLFQHDSLLSGTIVNFKELSFPSMFSNNYSRIYAYGGMLATLFYFSKNGIVSNEICYLALESEDIDENTYKDISYIRSYFFDSDFDNSPILMQMYYTFLDIIIEGEDFKENIIEFLQSFEVDGYEELAKSRTKEISDRLIQLETTMNSTVSEQFTKAKTPMEKLLLMLFLKEDTKDLMEYHLDLFSELDYILFAMMFGIRDKFSGIPKFLREYDNLQNYISEKMAIYAHKSTNSSIYFTESKKKPITITDMFGSDEFRKWFAKEYKIEDCFQTTLKIPKGNYELKVTSMGVEIVFDGIVETAESKIITEKLFKFMSSFYTEEYSKLLTKYGKVK